MTTTEAASRFRYEGNGVTTTFAFTGRIFAAADLVVERILRADDTLVDTLTLTTDYSVTINGPSSATVTVTNGSKVPSTLQDIQIRRDLTKAQSLNLPTGTVFPASSVETALDKLTAITQELQTQIDLKVGIPITDSGTPPDVITLLEDATAGADAAAAAAASSASSASTSASTATTQAGIATTQAGIATAASAYQYVYSTTTTASDPGSGNLRFNNTTLSSATALYISETTELSQAISAALAAWDDSTSTIKGQLKMVKRSTPATFALFNITGTITDSGAWNTFTVAYVAGNGTFSDSDSVSLAFTRTGDQGTSGGVNNIDFSLITTDNSPDAGSDEFLFNVGGALRKTIFDNLLKIIDGLGVETTVTLANDKFPFFDASANSPRAITGANLAAALGAPTGTVLDYAGSTEPTGYLFCFGQAVSRTTYSALFAVISTTYGVGDGSTTFNLPDLRGRVVAGKDNMGGTSANRLTGISGSLDGDVLGANGGSETYTQTSNTLFAHTHMLRQWTTVSGGGGLQATSTANAGAQDIGLQSGSTGSSDAMPNVQPTLILNKIIKI